MKNNGTSSSIVWSAVERTSTIGIQFILNIIIARILSPTDYGLIGMLTIFLSISQCLIDSGFSSALIQTKERTTNDYGTVFVFNLFISILVYLILFTFAPAIAKFYHQDILVKVLRVVGLNLIISSLSNVQKAILTIKIDFKKQSSVTVPSAIISGTVGILGAYNGLGVWSLVAQTLSNGFLQTVLFWARSEEHFKIQFDVRSFKKLGSFGVKLMFSGLLNTAYTNLYGLFIGKRYDAENLGFYTRAEQFSVFPATIFTDIISRVAFPILCQRQDDKSELSRVYTQFIKNSCFIIFPIMIGLAVLARPLIVILLTDKWEAAAILMSILAMDSLFSPITRINLQLLQAVGRSDLFLKLEIIKKSISIVILLITLKFGLLWICIGRLIYGLMALLINMYYTVDIINKSYFEQIGDWLPNFVIALSMGVIVHITTHLMTSPIFQLGIGVSVGVLSYFILSFLFNRETLNLSVEMVRSLFNK